MARVKLTYPADQTIFSTELRVRARDVNYGAHVGNDALVALLQEARIDWLRSLGYSSELNVEGKGLVQADLQVQYIAESFLGDMLTIHLAITELTKYGFELTYLVERNTKKIAIATSNLLFLDYQSKQLCPCPKPFKAKIS